MSFVSDIPTRSAIGSKRGAIIGATFLCVLMVLWGVVWWQLRPTQPGSQATVEFTVQPGWGTRRIATELADAKLIRSSLLFLIDVKIKGVSRDLQAGTYVLSPHMSTPEITTAIVTGQALSTDITLTIPEGVNIWQLDHILFNAHIIARAGAFSITYGAREGHLFPDTYRVPEDATATDVATRLQAEFQKRAYTFTPAQIIIASILEKEAKTPTDMALVAGIMQSRTARGMPLQVDATVAYGWCLRIAGYSRVCDATQAPIATEIKVDGPYNTYTRTGLPVGPISNPGLQALQAAAHPKSSDYLYYLSTRDGSQIIYAKTLDEHLKNRLKYLGF